MLAQIARTPVATIEPYQTASGAKLYMVRYRKPDNKQTMRRGFRSRRDAQMFAATVEVAKAKGQYVAPKLGRITVDELSTAWLARKSQATKPSHYRMLESAYRCHVRPRWATAAVADIELLGIEAWITAMVRGGSGATTVLRAYGVLAGILSDAVKGKRLAANPAQGVENLPKKTGSRRIYLTADDLSRFAEECGEHRALVLVLAYCGLRWGEAIGLRVRDVEFLRRRLSVHENARPARR